ncbi:MAG: hypothetical protein OEQ12_03065 [Nitrosopumilus sp.]|nr:hypothetical protein [Nitrosopumilus sp.]
MPKILGRYKTNQLSFNKKPFRKFQRNSKPQTTEEKIKNFVLRNSKNGYHTKVSTLSFKFEISQERAWEIVGELLDEGSIESIHDENSGEMKLCEQGQTYAILNLEHKRRREKSKESRKKVKNNPKK